GAGREAAEAAASTSSPAPEAASAAGQTVSSAPIAEAAPTAAAAPAPAAAPAAPDQPPPAADEPIKIGQGKSTPAREHMRQLRKAAEEHASQPRRKGA